MLEEDSPLEEEKEALNTSYEERKQEESFKYRIVKEKKHSLAQRLLCCYDSDSDDD
jgi:hypothetical protein